MATTTETPPFDPAVWNQIHWVEVEDGLALPNLVSMLQRYLDRDEGTDQDLDPGVIGEQILRQLQERKNVQRPGVESFRLSASGNCIRRMALDFHNVPQNGFKGDGSSRIVFAYGDAVEAMVTLALVDALRHLPLIRLDKILDKQETVTVQVQTGPGPWESFRVPGHPDGDLWLPRWRKGESPEQAWVNSHLAPVRAVLELKSASDFAFKKFREKGLQPTDSKTGNPDGYYYQTQAYQLARRQRGEDVAWSYMIMFGKGAGAKDAAVSPDFAPPITKSTGKPAKKFVVEDRNLWWKQPPIVGAWIGRDERVQADIVQRYTDVAQSEDPFAFPPALKPEGKRGMVKFPCDWCPHLFNCWPSAHEVAERYGWFNTVTKVRTITNNNDE